MPSGDGDGRCSTASRICPNRKSGRHFHPRPALCGEATRPDASGELGFEQPWFAMELIDGQSIVLYADSHRLNIRQRLELLIPVCDAVPRVIDFGVAKALGNRLTENSLHTEWGQAVGTLEYMSPEQSGRNPADVDTRSDVYSLGVMLYQLLAGSTPINRSMPGDSSPLELMRLVREVEPQRPSTRVVSTPDPATISANRYAASPIRLAAELRGDLDWIAAKAIDKDRARRYQSASAVASDLKKHLAGLPVDATPPSLAYRLRKFVRRNRTATIGGSLLVLALVAGSIGTTVGMIGANRQRVIAEGERDDKDKALERLAGEQEKTRSALKSERAAREGAMSALRTLTDSAVERLLARQTELDAGDKSFLRRIIEQYQGLVTLAGDDAESRVIRAEGYTRVGHIHLVLGDAKSAQECCSRSLEILDSLVGDFPASAEYRRLLAETLVDRGDAWARTGNDSECETDFGKSIETLLELLNEDANSHDARKLLIHTFLQRGNHRGRSGRLEESGRDYREALELCEVHSAFDPAFALDIRGRLEVNLGVLYRRAGDGEKAVAAYTRAIGLYGETDESTPATAERNSFLANAHHNLANLLSDMKQFGQADVEYREALGVRQKLAAEFPSVPAYQSELANTHVSFAALLNRMGKPREAELELDRAMALLERLVEDFPEQPAWQISLAGACCNAGIARRDFGEFDLALQQFDRAIALLQPLFERNAEMADVRKFLVNSLYSRALTLMKIEDFEQSLAAWDQVLALDPASLVVRIRRATCLAWLDPGPAAEFALELARTNPNGLRDAARILAICSQNTGDEDTAEEYSAEAVEILTRLRDAHPDKRTEILESVNTDPSLSPLRDREDFKALLQSLED